MLVVAAALVDGAGKVLMQQRRLTAVHGGLWEFPGGKVEAGETPEQALAREIREELAVEIDPKSLTPLQFATHGADPPMGKTPIVLLLYTCSSWQGEPQCLDAETLDWFSVEEMPVLDMPPLDRPLAQALAASSAVPT
ncbi:MAG: (deoxy)nucleoside triphosphate pyrophosphohydrolase [Novosphingobium sp.]|nr:(deoxy)nucleoside triphosphate pyrophosphohydrolase [Novosphingobium sp.]